MSNEIWATSKDAVPAGHVQITVYNESTGKRVATVFESEAYANLVKAAPVMLRALQQILSINGSTGGPQSLVNEFKHIAAIAVDQATN